jgi:arylsulfatase A-like enzyme
MPAARAWSDHRAVIGRWTAAMALGASIGYFDVLHALGSHPNTQGGMRNFGAPLALATAVATVAFWALSLAADALSAPLRIRSPRAAALAIVATLFVVGGSLPPAADRLAGVRILLSCSVVVLIAFILYRGFTHLGRFNGRQASLLAPSLLAASVFLSVCVYRRTVGPVQLALLLPLVLILIAVLARGTGSTWLISVPWVAALLSPMADWTPPFPSAHQWISGSGVAAGVEGGRPSVLFISVDALRADALPVYGGKAATTPVLDRLAGGSYVFEQARSTAPWTLPAMASMFTGVDVPVHGVANRLTPIPRQLITLPEVFHRDGYYTAAFGAGNAGLPEDEREFWRGFDRFEFVSAALPSTMWASPLLPRLLPRSYSLKLSATDFAPRAAAYLAQQRGMAFTWVHFFDTHSPYRSHGPGPAREFGELGDIQAGLLVPTPDERREVRALYDAEVEEVDRGVGIILDGLRRSGGYDRTLIVFVADHGEEFWDHGSIGHGRSLHQDQIHVPLMIKVPGKPGGIRICTPVTTANVAATVSEAVRLRAGVAGQSLSAAWRSAEVLPQLPVVSGMASSAEDPRRAVTFDTWTYIRAAANGREELYNLVEDPEERNSLADVRLDQLDRGRALLRAADGDARRAITLLGLPPSTREIDPVLRSMGYIQ